MTNHPAPLRFTTLRRFDIRTGPGAVVAVFFEPADTSRDQKPNANSQQQSGQRKPQGLRSV
ncbi:hypothetical protein ARC78_07520 [Stenotrophomonas pictorum JCM 9942]|uniref:Uncharacterized protein n=1 Tax=Stenotrophomonas pictorum JCM 9942 TaxID=1236960 RepID=A0A0R0AQ51_9GAMM|nr:hypothetical protein ARC78_07520 [Stenotrophomonas pictorum JCM 9942]